MLLVIGALAMAWRASAQTLPPGETREITVKARRPVVVTAVTCPAPDAGKHPTERDPAVVDSYPQPGAIVRPGYLRVRVSFDQPMSCFSEVMVDAGPGDPCEPEGTWALPERKSWTMTCRFAPETAVRIGFRRIDGEGFVGLSGRRATPYLLEFSTSGDAPTSSLQTATTADPGPPGQGRPTTALVTCEGQGSGAGVGRDCRRATVSPP
jgi:hypothetical protein